MVTMGRVQNRTEGQTLTGLVSSLARWHTPRCPGAWCECHGHPKPRQSVEPALVFRSSSTDGPTGDRPRRLGSRRQRLPADALARAGLGLIRRADQAVRSAQLSAAGGYRRAACLGGTPEGFPTYAALHHPGGSSKYIKTGRGHSPPEPQKPIAARLPSGPKIVRSPENL